MNMEREAVTHGPASLDICVGEFTLLRTIGARYDAGDSFDIDEECSHGANIGAIRKLNAEQRTEFASMLCEKGLWGHQGGRRYNITEKGESAFNAICPNADAIRAMRDGAGWRFHA